MSTKVTLRNDCNGAEDKWQGLKPRNNKWKTLRNDSSFLHFYTGNYKNKLKKKEQNRSACVATDKIRILMLCLFLLLIVEEEVRNKEINLLGSRIDRTKHFLIGIHSKISLENKGLAWKKK